jgi:hypothetical protein
VAFRRSTRPTGKNYLPTLCRSVHLAADTTSAGSRWPSSPCAVVMRNSQYAEGGTGSQGEERHHFSRRRGQAARATVSTSRGWRTK